jgi:D-aspartate ligase
VLRDFLTARAVPGAARAVACVMGDLDMLRPVAMAGIPAAVVAGPDDPVRFSRLARAVIDRHDAWTEQERQVEALMAFARRLPVPPVLFYARDADLLLVSRHRAALADGFRFVIADADLIDAVVDKARFRRLAERLRLPVPLSRHVRPAREPPHDLGLRFPLLVKPLTRHGELWGPVAGAAKAVRVESGEELAVLWSKLADADLEVLVQELVAGPERRIESYHAYVDAGGEVAGEFTGRKLRTLPAAFGHSTALTTTDASDVAEQGRDVVRALELRGVVKIDFKRAPSGELRLLEVNPRFSLWHHLGAVAGVNLPAIVYADLTGTRRPPRCRARPGVTWRIPMADRRAARAEGVPLRRWLRWAAGSSVFSHVAWDDPMPVIRGKVLPRLARR